MRYIGSIIFVVLIVLLVFGAIQFKDTSHYQIYKTKVTNLIQYIKQWVGVKKHNISMTYDLPSPKEEWMTAGQETTASRRPPVSLLVVKTKLENFFPDSFVKELDQSDWNYIFNLIYELVDGQQGDFKIKRYLTKEEIEQDLIYQYSFPFSYFRQQHWDYFWDIVLRNG